MERELYKKTTSHSFEYLNGREIHADTEIRYAHYMAYIEEVKLLQKAVGADPDGIIGPKTREAAEKVYQARQQTTIGIIDYNDVPITLRMIIDAWSKAESFAAFGVELKNAAFKNRK